MNCLTWLITAAAPKATITSSQYLLIRDADVEPKQFVCKGDGAKVFKLGETGTAALDLTEVWDFGSANFGKGDLPWPGEFCSYSYHMPYYNLTDEQPGFAITAMSNPACPLSADRNPYMDKNSTNLPTEEEDADPDIFRYDAEDDRLVDETGILNSRAHNREGQNVLFNDIHVEFEITPACGVDNDNIWLPWPADAKTPTPKQRIWDDIPRGPISPGDIEIIPASEKDAVLVNELNCDPSLFPANLD